RDRNELDDIGGLNYLIELSKMVESSEKIESLCKILIEKHMAREIIRHSLYIASKGYDGTVNVFDLLNEAEAGFFEISENKFKKNYLSLSEIVRRTIENIDRIRSSEVSGIPTGYPTLNVLTGGFQKSDLIIIAARPGIGKTAFGISLALNIAKNAKKSVGFFSLEMKAEQIVIRLLSQESRIDVSRLRTGRYDKSEETKLIKAIRSLSLLNIFIDDTPAISLHELRAKARRMILENKVEIIFVDYLQLMQGPANAESREREISYISRGLKALAKELDIPIIALAQLNRQVEIRQTKRPMLSDLRESGAIEQDADIVCFLHRPDLYSKKSDENVEEDNPFNPKPIEVIIAKQRNGPTGTLDFVFLPSITRFEEKSTHEFRQIATQKEVIIENYEDFSSNEDTANNNNVNLPDTPF
ncbi:MAG: replicative DNA helicase, partial [Ignavibacteria bacterium]